MSPDRMINLQVGFSISTVDADPIRIEQVLDNLLENARKSSEPETAVEVELRQVDDEVRVLVTNRGPGISAEELPKLFDRYYRTPSARAGSARGLGLGLYIAKGLMETHGGRIWAESRSGQTTFQFALPARGRGSVALTRATSSGLRTRYRGRPFSREQLRGSGDELREVERLAQQPGVLAERAYLRRDALVDQRGYEDDRRAKTGGACGLHRLQAVHPGHRDVGDNEIKGPFVSHLLDELCTAGGARDFRSEVCQCVDNCRQQQRVVIGDEHTCVIEHARRQAGTVPSSRARPGAILYRDTGPFTTEMPAATVHRRLQR